MVFVGVSGARFGECKQTRVNVNRAHASFPPTSQRIHRFFTRVCDTLTPPSGAISPAANISIMLSNHLHPNDQRRVIKRFIGLLLAVGMTLLAGGCPSLIQVGKDSSRGNDSPEANGQPSITATTSTSGTSAAAITEWDDPWRIIPLEGRLYQFEYNHHHQLLGIHDPQTGKLNIHGLDWIERGDDSQSRQVHISERGWFRFKRIEHLDLLIVDDTHSVIMRELETLQPPKSWPSDRRYVPVNHKGRRPAINPNDRGSHLLVAGSTKRPGSLDDLTPRPMERSEYRITSRTFTEICEFSGDGRHIIVWTPAPALYETEQFLAQEFHFGSPTAPVAVFPGDSTGYLPDPVGEYFINAAGIGRVDRSAEFRTWDGLPLTFTRDRRHVMLRRDGKLAFFHIDSGQIVAEHPLPEVLAADNTRYESVPRPPSTQVRTVTAGVSTLQLKAFLIDGNRYLISHPAGLGIIDADRVEPKSPESNLAGDQGVESIRLAAESAVTLPPVIAPGKTTELPIDAEAGSVRIVQAPDFVSWQNDAPESGVLECAPSREQLGEFAMVLEITTEDSATLVRRNLNVGYPSLDVPFSVTGMTAHRDGDRLLLWSDGTMNPASGRRENMRLGIWDTQSSALVANVELDRPVLAADFAGDEVVVLCRESIHPTGRPMGWTVIRFDANRLAELDRRKRRHAATDLACYQDRLLVLSDPAFVLEATDVTTGKPSRWHPWLDHVHVAKDPVVSRTPDGWLIGTVLTDESMAFPLHECGVSSCSPLITLMHRSNHHNQLQTRPGTVHWKPTRRRDSMTNPWEPIAIDASGCKANFQSDSATATIRLKGYWDDSTTPFVDVPIALSPPHSTAVPSSPDADPWLSTPWPHVVGDTIWTLVNGRCIRLPRSLLDHEPGDKPLRIQPAIYPAVVNPKEPLKFDVVVSGGTPPYQTKLELEINDYPGDPSVLQRGGENQPLLINGRGLVEMLSTTNRVMARSVLDIMRRRIVTDPDACLQYAQSQWMTMMQRPLLDFDPSLPPDRFPIGVIVRATVSDAAGQQSEATLPVIVPADEKIMKEIMTFVIGQSNPLRGSGRFDFDRHSASALRRLLFPALPEERGEAFGIAERDPSPPTPLHASNHLRQWAKQLRPTQQAHRVDSGSYASLRYHELGNRVTFRSRTSDSDLESIRSALLAYVATFGHYPPPVILSDDGRPLLSWRVALLPMLGHVDLFLDFNLDEPYDSEHNLKVSQRMPEFFRDRIKANHSPLPQAKHPAMAKYSVPLSDVNCVIGSSGSFPPDRLIFADDPGDPAWDTVLLYRSEELRHWTAPPPGWNLPVSNLPDVPQVRSPGVAQFAGIKLLMADGRIVTFPDQQRRGISSPRPISMSTLFHRDDQQLSGLPLGR